jgi:hypothetical protein
LPLQICDLLFGIRDLLFAFGNLFFAFDYLMAKLFVLEQSLIFTTQLFPAGLGGVSMAVLRCPLLPRTASRSRTHPPYGKRFGRICPAKID